MGVKVPTVNYSGCRVRAQGAGVFLHAERCTPHPVRYTLRLLGGLHPLCGIGVTSLMDRTWSPAEASA